MKTRLACLVLSLVLGSSACATTVPPEAKPATPPAAPANYPTEFRTEAGVVVKRGMTAAEVAKLLGEPKEKRTLKTEGELSEVWVYRTERVVSAPKTIQSDRIVTTDNGFGYTEHVDVATYRLEHTTNVEIRELLMFRGRLLNWKETRGVKRTMQ